MVHTSWGLKVSCLPSLFRVLTHKEHCWFILLVACLHAGLCWAKTNQVLEGRRSWSCSVMSRKPRVSFVLSALQSLFTCSSLNFAFVEIAEKLLMSVEKDLLISVLNRSCCITTCSESWISLLLQQRWLFYNVFYKVLWNPLIKRFLQVCKLFTYLESEREELSHTVAQSKLGVHQQQ